MNKTNITMAQRIQLILLVLITMSMSFGFISLVKLSYEQQILLEQIKDMQMRFSNLESRSIQKRQPAAIQGKIQNSDRIQRLEQQFAEQTLLTENSKTRLDQEKNSRNTNVTIDHLKKVVTQQKEKINDLQGSLADIKEQEIAIETQSHVDQALQSEALKIRYDQFTNQIILERQSLEQLKQQLKVAYEISQNDFSNQSAADIVKALEMQVAAQGQLIENLKDQQAVEITQGIYQKNYSLFQYQLDREDLLAYARLLEEELTTEKETLLALQNNLNTGVQSENTHQILVRSAEMDYQVQKAKLDRIQKRLNEEKGINL